MARIGIIIGSTRPGRRGPAVGRWVHQVAVTDRPAVTFEILDLADFGLPLLDEPCPAAMGQYRYPHTHAWANAVARCDGFVFVTPEYNHSTSAAMKNAIDYLFAEWHDKAAGFVSYGVTGGWRATEALRLILAEVRVAGVRTAVGLSLFTDFSASGLTPAPHQRATLQTMLDELLTWSSALSRVRQS
ncbi:NAD(P)H-dependent oxidoreductase [Dactylosporangium fulvum]|uniref:NAD(P)H-dependent oxidoreductase n=1 Tax=Dactylosporangium fulvum TaxID=53359 RepID=A0ABY5VXQ1_9ACTN|nr:NAD(P)H-dependent oxidoreductase [Dactylosporangium fulvum]UWP82537.1 NAD(P)H-dependent oxidoreductase [Dactylosporangium fulvum]